MSDLKQAEDSYIYRPEEIPEVIYEDDFCIVERYKSGLTLLRNKTTADSMVPIIHKANNE